MRQQMAHKAHNILLKISGIVAISSIIGAILSLLPYLNLHYFLLAYLCEFGVFITIL